MKNLKIMDVQEMNAHEMKKVDGGFLKLLGAVGGILSVALYLVDATADYVKGISDGFKEGSHYEH